jgi:hypothetical protein
VTNSSRNKINEFNEVPFFEELQIYRPEKTNALESHYPK